MEWQEFLDDPDVDTRFGHQPPEKHLFGKMVHDILESINAILGWSRMGEIADRTADFPAPARAWLVRHTPALQQERAAISTLVADFLTQRETGEWWLRLVDDVGQRARRIAALRDDLGSTSHPSAPFGQHTLDVIWGNLQKLELIGKDIQAREYKRLWMLNYRDLIQTP